MDADPAPRRRRLLSAAGALLLAGCAGTAAMPQEQPAVLALQLDGAPAGRGVDLLQRSRPFAHLDPQRLDEADARAFTRAFLLRSLTGYGRGRAGGRSVPRPDLAVALGTPGAGATTWRYTLRTGVRFEDGTPVTAREVRYGVSRLFARELHGGGRPDVAELLSVPASYPGPYRATTIQQRAFDRAVEASADGRQITFHLSRSVPDFDRWAALPALGPVPAAADDGRRYDQHPLATGPYRIERFVAGAAVVLVRNLAWSDRDDPLRTRDADRLVVLFDTGRSP
jgi:peptide/nickel transport system substrate-binding protein